MKGIFCSLSFEETLNNECQKSLDSVDFICIQICTLQRTLVFHIYQPIIFDLSIYIFKLQPVK